MATTIMTVRRGLSSWKECSAAMLAAGFSKFCAMNNTPSAGWFVFGGRSGFYTELNALTPGSGEKFLDFDCLNLGC